MSRQVVFVGGPQLAALARAYRSAGLGGRGQGVSHIGPVAASRDAGRTTLGKADVVVMETGDNGDVVPDTVVPAKAERIRVPHLVADFLWPFAGQAHPQNRGIFPIVGGPYPAEHGDSFLDQMAEQNVPEDEAVARYLALDIAKEANLDAKLADRLARLRKADEQTGFSLAAIIEAEFRTTQLFISRERPSFTLMRKFAGQVFARLGVKAELAEKWQKLGYPLSEQPIHPGVARHFNLRYITPDQRYMVNDEGRFTFEEQCHRYWRFEWNEPLHRGIQLARTNPTQAITELDRGLAWSPDSVRGQRALKEALAATGQGEAPPPENDDGSEAGDNPAPAEKSPSGQTAAYIELGAAPAPAPPPGLSAAATEAAEVQEEMVEALPQMLPTVHSIADAYGHSHGLVDLADLMPPPPLKPVLPPEMPGEVAKKGFFARMLGK